MGGMSHDIPSHSNLTIDKQAMMNSDAMETPDNFDFPFPPYKSQEEFMKKLYWAIEHKKLGIFESPTGTGKSLALICGAVRWLRDHESRELLAAREAVDALQPSGSGAAASTAAAPDQWLAEQATDRHRCHQLRLAERRLAALQRARLVRPQGRHPQAGRHSQPATELPDTDQPEPPEDEALLLDDIDHSGDDDCPEEDSDDEDEHLGTQIIYTSRTHSQLSQFVAEVRRSPYAAHVRVAVLASRPQLCINDTVSRLANVALVNQACLDLQQKTVPKPTKASAEGRAQKKQKADGACPFKRHVDDLAAEILSDVKDIEQLVQAGRKRKACPYYASRRAVRHAQLVVVPYNNLLHRGTREASGLRLANSVVIVDEAHNLLEAINGIHSCQLTRRQMADAGDQLQLYVDTYRSRFSPRNLLHLKQLLFVHQRLLRLIDGSGPTDPAAGSHTRVLQANDLVCEAGIDNINMKKLLVFAEKNRLVQKLRGCWKRRQVTPSADRRLSSVGHFLQELKQPTGVQPTPPVVPAVETRCVDTPLIATLQLLGAISEPDTDCRLLITTDSGEPPHIKYLPLNAAAHFTAIVRQARAVILAGGTMKPVSEFRDQLFLAAGGEPERVLEFCCDHVVPPDQLVALALATGPSGAALQFSYQSRGLPGTMDELGRLLLSLCRLVPGGIVCFLPSYEYAGTVLDHLTRTGVLGQMSARKQVLREPRGSSGADLVLSEYSRVVRAGQNQQTPSGTTGAILFCVVGGKMSEGINFSDELGRCVVVVGLPYPNSKSPELIEKMRFLDTHMKCSTDGRTPGQVLYENLCMKAVNQSIGRAIRHRDDYACVVLCDSRYCRPGTSAGLPDWIQRRLQHHNKFGPAFGQIRQFFVRMRDKFP